MCYTVERRTIPNRPGSHTKAHLPGLRCCRAREGTSGRQNAQFRKTQTADEDWERGSGKFKPNSPRPWPELTHSKSEIPAPHLQRHPLWAPASNLDPQPLQRPPQIPPRSIFIQPSKQLGMVYPLPLKKPPQHSRPPNPPSLVLH